MILAITTIQLLLVGLGLTYFTTMAVLGLRFARGASRPDPELAEPHGPVPRHVYYLVPCLNEEEVIGETVRRMADDERAHVVVVDDGSTDRTADLAIEAATEIGAADRLQVHRRRPPNARLGKGPALNAGLPLIEADIARRGLASQDVVVCVMDADGRLSEGALDEVLPLFADPSVGGVQLAVRIRNRRSCLLTQLQDMEFWALSGISQFGRARFGTVSLGGNGQFTRLSALRSVGPEPWAAALTEDLELALELAFRGWRLTTTAAAYVDQQALTSLRRLVRQRTRWFQGHMTAYRHLPRIWSSRHLSHAAALELIAYLLVPWLLVLPWSVVFNISVLWMVLSWSQMVGSPLASAGFGTGIGGWLLWYLLSFAPNLAAGFLYRYRDPEVSLLRALALGHALVPNNYIAYTSCWRAVDRMIKGYSGWAKTQRVAEGAAPVVATAPGGAR